MKRALPLIAAGAFSLGAIAFTADADAQQGGFIGPDNLRLVTVAEALELPDDSHVKVQGRIVRAIGDEKYEFTDDSATIVVEIDDDDWNGVEATPDLLVEVIGEIDRDWNGNELDVDSVRQL